MMEYLEKHESMTVGDICGIFQVSRDTARRDIVKLTEQGAVIRTHGGIALTKFNQKIQEYVSRLTNEPEVKKEIGAYAATYVKDNDMIFLDVSTTVQCMIPHLKVQSLTVITQSMDNAWLLMENDRVQTYIMGGLIQPKTRQALGYDTLAKLADYRFNKIFIGATGITHEGVYYFAEEDISFKRELAKRAEQVIILADHTKFGKYSSYKGLDLNAVDIMITDRPVAKGLQENIESEGIQLITLQDIEEDGNV
ncbi:MAG TPA: DeoR/GlpR family DNA-binding transcription regulator [Bacillota bacterium]